jgi:hypothetical protein
MTAPGQCFGKAAHYDDAAEYVREQPGGCSPATWKLTPSLRDSLLQYLPEVTSCRGNMIEHIEVL